MKRKRDKMRNNGHMVNVIYYVSFPSKENLVSNLTTSHWWERSQANQLSWDLEDTDRHYQWLIYSNDQYLCNNKHITCHNNKACVFVQSIRLLVYCSIHCSSRTCPCPPCRPPSWSSVSPSQTLLQTLVVWLCWKSAQSLSLWPHCYCPHHITGKLSNER